MRKMDMYGVVMTDIYTMQCMQIYHALYQYLYYYSVIYKRRVLLDCVMQEQ